MATMNFYTYSGSQWAQIVHLAIAYKRIPKDKYTLHNVDLFAAGNFDPDYLQINPNGTIPSMTSPSLPEPLIHSGDILDYLDEHYPHFRQLTPVDPSARKAVTDMVNLVHSDRMSTNVIFLRARNAEEMRGKQVAVWKDFVVKRQNKLLEHKAKNPDHPFYSKKLEDESVVYKAFTTNDMHQEMFSRFFKESTDAYARFAAGMNELNSLLVLPYAAGHHETTADFHVIPWLAHAMYGAGGTEVHDFRPLESTIKASIPEFVVGPRIKEWWSHVSQCSWFQEVYPKLH